MNVRGVKDCEVLLIQLNNTLIQDNPHLNQLFNKIKDSKNTQQSGSLSVTNLILPKLAALDVKILMVFDNAEELIDNDKINFKKLVGHLLT